MTPAAWPACVSTTSETPQPETGSAPPLLSGAIWTNRAWKMRTLASSPVAQSAATANSRPVKGPEATR